METEVKPIEIRSASEFVPRCPLYRRYREKSGSSADIAFLQRMTRFGVRQESWQKQEVKVPHGVRTSHPPRPRIVHIAQGFEFLGFKIGRGKGRFKLIRDRIKSKLNRQNLYAIPTQKSVDRFKDQIRALTMRRIPLRLGELIETINPIIRGWETTTNKFTSAKLVERVKKPGVAHPAH